MPRSSPVFSSRLYPLGDCAFAVEVKRDPEGPEIQDGDESREQIDPSVNDRVLAFARAVERLAPAGVIETVPAYRSATVYFDPGRTDATALARRLQTVAERVAEQPRVPHGTGRHIDVPVLYGGEWGPDLRDLAAFAKLSISETIAHHTAVKYRVYMLGFSPGFPYLGLVPERLAMPRLENPRVRVPGGTVGIAGRQSGIYPIDSPGGWRLIGRTPLRLFDPAAPSPFLFQAGDRVRFYGITREEYDRLSHGGPKAGKRKK